MSQETPVVTTVHDIQVVDFIPAEPFDLPIDSIYTNSRTINCPRNIKPKGIIWEYLDENKIKAIPLLSELRASVF